MNRIYLVGKVFNPVPKIKYKCDIIFEKLKEYFTDSEKSGKKN